MRRSWVLALPLLFVPASAAVAQEDGGCVYERVIYPEGAEMCQGGSRVRCEEGDWASIGMCDEDDTPPPPPNEGGGDEIEADDAKMRASSFTER